MGRFCCEKFPDDPAADDVSGASVTCPELHQTVFAITGVEAEDPAYERRCGRQTEEDAEPLVYSCQVHHDEKDEESQQAAGEEE